MLSKSEIKAEITDRLVPKYRASLTWGQLVDAVKAASEAEKLKLLREIRSENWPQIGRLLSAGVKRHIRVLAETEADTILANDSLDLTELDRIL